jgi:hypothetical protein
MLWSVLYEEGWLFLWPDDEGDETLGVSNNYQIMFHVLNFTTKIILFLAYDFGFIDQTIYNSSFYVLEMIRFKLQIMSCMSKYLVNLCG